MALWKFYAFRAHEDMENWLNGALIGSVDLSSGANVNGKTFIVDIGGGNVTVTFSGTDPMSAQEIVDDINASLAGLASIYSSQAIAPAPGFPWDKKLKLSRDGTIVVAAAGTANAALGFSASSPTTRVGVNPSDVKRIEQSNEGEEWYLWYYA